ncbi:type IX secretion system motor protein PorL/GldL [Bacteroides heparinolyticus]|uniref:type IX secretion system motor protein PorL/GldL n=1 Tax=Prevotella heparinolytica TaxID=28113 RepID=UPI0035A119C9
MSKNQAATIKQPGKFSIWYNSNVGQRTVAAFYSVGASVVILGALFKIMHWPFAGIILTAGMITEAILFFIGVFEKPHKNYHWENVYPSLLINNEGPVAAVSANERMGISDASLAQSDAKKLEDGIKQLAETAGQLGNISQAAANSEVFAKNLSNASDAVASFTTKQQSLDEVSGNMIKSYQEISGSLSNASEGAKQYASKTEILGNNISAINSLYELELKNIQAQAEAISSQTSKLAAASLDIDKLFSIVANTAKDMEAYKQQTEKLAKQVSDLNSVYGNMLNAIRS